MKKGEKRRKVIYALILSTLFLLIWYSPEISGLFNNPPQDIEISLCKTNNLYVDVTAVNEYIRLYVNVPDYDVKAYINFKEKSVEIGNPVHIGVEIEDVGINKLKKPYFYILVFNPDEEIESIFPCFYNNEEEVAFGFGHYLQSGGTRTWITDKIKWDRWVPSTRTSICGEDEFYFYQEDEHLCISRLDFMGGMYQDRKIEYSYTSDKVGTWKVFVFLFDEEYSLRKNIVLYDEDTTLEHAIAYFEGEFIVEALGKEEGHSLDIIGGLRAFGGILGTIALWYGIFASDKFYRIINKMYEFSRKKKLYILAFLVGGVFFIFLALLVLLLT